MRMIFTLIIITAGILIVPPHAFAVDYSIEKMQIDAFLQEDGGVDVTEKQTYRFKGKFNGITRTLIPKRGTSITDVAASENGSPLEVEQESNLYKIYRSGKSEKITIELTYTINNAVEAYADVAQFYWPFFDTSNESDYEQLDVFIHPPSPTDDVIAFGYQAAEETASTNNDGVAHFNMGKVPSETKGDIRVVYDVKLFPNAAIVENKPKRDEILAAKKSLTDKRIQFETIQSKLRTIAPFIVGLFTLYLIALLFQAWRNKRLTMAEIDRLHPLPYFVPDEVMSLPATIVYTNFGAISPETLTAALLDLVRKGYVDQKDEDTFILEDRNTEHDHERLLIDWLFYEIGQNGTFKLTDLKDYTDKKSNRTDYTKDFTAWQKAVREEVKQNELIKKNSKVRWTIGLSSILIIPFTILFIIYELFGYMFVTFMLFSSLLIFAFFYIPRTINGARMKRDWTEFQNKYVDMSDTEWSELVDDEQKRAFIYGVGINNKRIKNKNQAMLDRMPAPQYDGMSPLLFIFIASNANTHFNEADKVTAATSSSSGAGGGTGVGGGGGGSGAF